MSATEDSAAERVRAWRQPGFKIRSTGIAIDEDRLLVHTIGPKVAWWALPGGGPDFQELAADTLRREMVEELGAEVEVGRLLFVVERTFTARAGLPAHHLDLAFEMSVPAEVRRRRGPWAGATPEEYGDLLFDWVTLDALGSDPPFYPAFLVEHLRAPLPRWPVHVTSRT